LSEADDLEQDSVNISRLSVESLEEFVWGASFCIDSEDDLLEWILSLGCEYRRLLRWIEIRFLRASGLATLANHFTFPTEWIWCSIADRAIPHFRFAWNSRIVSDFPEILHEFSGK
jgi:hypothetical protein